MFVARVKEGGKLHFLPGSRCRLAHQSARFVAVWYRRKFGPNWPAAVAGRCRRYWHVWESDEYGGWIINVWVRGTMRTVYDGKGPRVFPSRSEAIAYARAWLARKRESWGAWRT